MKRLLIAPLLLAALAVPSTAHADGAILDVVYELPLQGATSGWAMVARPLAVYQSDGQHVVGVDLGTGLVRWQYDTKGVPIRTIRNVGDLILVHARDLVLLDPATGTVEWTYPLECDARGSCQLYADAIHEESFVSIGFGGSRTSVLPVDFRSRSQTWPSWVDVGPTARAWSDGKHILLSDPTGTTLTAVDFGMGRMRWRAELPARRSGHMTAPLSVWSSDVGVHVYRAVPGGGASIIDTLSLADGSLVRRVSGVRCPADVSRCGVIPGSGGAVSWLLPPPSDRRKGHVMLHDFNRGTAPVDSQGALAGPPVVLEGTLAVYGWWKSHSIELVARWLPTGNFAWRREIPGSGGRLHLVADRSSVVVAVEPDGLLARLSVVDGEMQALGFLTLAGEPITGIHPGEQDTVVTTSQRILVVGARSASELAQKMRSSYAAGEPALAEALDDRIVRLARFMPAAARAHAVSMRHGFLRVYAAFAAGGDASKALRRLAEIVQQGPADSPELLVETARGLNNAATEWFLGHRGGADSAQAAAFADVVKGWLRQLRAVDLAKLDVPSRDVINAAGLQVSEVLAATRRDGVALELLRALAAGPFGLTPATLPSPLRRFVARQAAATLRSAAAGARSAPLETSVEKVASVFNLPFFDGVVPFDDPHREKLEDLRDYVTAPSRRTVTRVTQAAARAWDELGSGAGLRDEIECFESCQRRHLTCERPCVSKAACDSANLACVDSCETTRRPDWPRPVPEPGPPRPAFFGCL